MAAMTRMTHLGHPRGRFAVVRGVVRTCVETRYTKMFDPCPGRKPMRRRDVVKLILTSLAFDPLAARAQRAIPVIGALSPAARPAQFETSFYVGFSQGMGDLGYVEGRDYLIEWRFAGGDYARLPELASAPRFYSAGPREVSGRACRNVCSVRMIGCVPRMRHVRESGAQPLALPCIDKEGDDGLFG
jgi:hypothetical protein